MITENCEERTKETDATGWLYCKLRRLHKSLLRWEQRYMLQQSLGMEGLMKEINSLKKMEEVAHLIDDRKRG